MRPRFEDLQDNGSTNDLGTDYFCGKCKYRFRYFDEWDCDFGLDYTECSMCKYDEMREEFEEDA